MSLVAKLPAKRIIACTIGQSVELGHTQTYDGFIDIPFSSKKGACTDPIQPNGTTTGSAWPLFVDYMADLNIAVTIANTAKAATGLVHDWLGDSVGDGSGVPYSSADGKPPFDPNDYLSDALAEIDSGTYDEAWMFLAFGQHDAAHNVSLANYQLALENVTKYFLDNGVRCALGMTVNNAGIDTWMANNGNPALTAALSTFSNNSSVVAGANLYTTFGSVAAPMYLQSDNVHMVKRGTELMAKALFDALNGTAFTQ